MPQNDLDKVKDSSDPSSNGESERSGHPSDILKQYLASYVDVLELANEELSDIFEGCTSTIILTSTSENGYEIIVNIKYLIVKKVGSRNNRIILLISREGSDELEGLKDNPENIVIRTGALLRFHHKHLPRFEETVTYDFLVNTNDSRVVVAVSNEGLQNPDDLSPTLDAPISTTALSHWVSPGEEELLIDKESHTIIDFRTDPVETTSKPSSNYIQRIIFDIDSEEPDTTNKVYRDNGQNYYISDVHVGSMTNDVSSKLSTIKLVTSIKIIATMTLLALSFV